jgi:hypothetical protein
MRLVQNVMYVGKVREAQQVYEGEHAGIIDAELWDRANEAVKRWRTSPREERRNACQSSTVERKAEGAASASVPRTTRLLALALKLEQMVQEGTVKNYSELARLGQVSAARISQVMNLLHLAPDIQEEILLGNTPRRRLRESAIRKLSGVVLWSEQRDRWHELLRAASLQ